MKCFLISVCLTVGMVSLAERANADCCFGTGIYWGDYYNATVGSASLDGSHPTDALIAGDPGGVYGIGLSSNAIYWANLGIGTIGTADLSGNNVNQSLLGSPEFLPILPIVSGGYIYWFDAIMSAPA